MSSMRKLPGAGPSRGGFTLIELMIVVAILALLAALAVPVMMRSRMAANEAAAISSMRTITTGEFGFQAAGYIDAVGDGVGDFGTLEQLVDPQGNGLPGFIDDNLGEGFRNGYAFEVAVTLGDINTAPAFVCLASPIDTGVTGIRRFFSNESGVIRFTNDGTQPNANSVPLQ